MADLGGRVIKNQYQLTQLVGSGGMADVYLANDALRHTPMAVKILRRDLAENDQVYSMFGKEAGVLRQLEHPYIVRLYESGKDGDLTYIVMEWVDGSNLRQHITERSSPMTPVEVLHILQPVTSALAFAHNNKIYHCDVKPANILLHKDGRILLTDFGVARLASEHNGAGTPFYMAPEQFEGTVNAKTDIYALGISVYEMLSGGQLPYRGKTSSISSKSTRERLAWEHQNLPLPSLRLANPYIPHAVEAVVNIALVKEADRRYRSPLDFCVAFERACTNDGSTYIEQPTLKSPVSKPSAPKPPPTRQVIGQDKAKPHPVKGVHLIARSGDYAGRTISITVTPFQLGRSQSCHLPFNEASVSRDHAVIYATPQGFVIQDRGSKLGTFVNGRRVQQPVRLRNGDIIQIGYYQILEFRER